MHKVADAGKSIRAGAKTKSQIVKLLSILVEDSRLEIGLLFAEHSHSAAANFGKLDLESSESRQD